jgi:hypothetical protein
MSNPEDGTTDFRVGGLKDLLESQESPPKTGGGGGGGGKNRQMMIAAAAGAVILVIVAVVLLAGGGGGDDDDTASGDGVPVGIDMKPSAAVGVQPGKKASICDTASGPIAEGVVVQNVKTGKSNTGADIVTLTVLASGGDINDLGPTNAKSTWRAIAADSCPAVTSTSTPPESTTTTLPATPPDSVPTPPPS